MRVHTNSFLMGNVETLLFMAICWQLSLVALGGDVDPAGFLTIDCGLLSGNWSSKETRLTYIPDTNYVESGDTYTISDQFTTHQDEAFRTLRSFKTGISNCYTLNELEEGHKYLVRASFLYGNYDNLNSAAPGNPILFDIYLGSQFWDSLKITDPSDVYSVEVLTIARTRYISVCLRNRNLGVPFISLLELRPLNNQLYPDLKLDLSLITRARYNMGGNFVIRYPDDTNDRIWTPRPIDGCNNISSKASIGNLAKDPYQVPLMVLQTAVTPAGFGALNLTSTSGAAYICFFCTDFTFRTNKLILYDGQTYGDPFEAPYMSRSYYWRDGLSEMAQYNFSLDSATVTDRPVLNALEIFGAMNVPDGLNGPTNNQDVYAIMEIKKEYQIKKNWTGDPCSPDGLTWEGIVCNKSASASPQILKLDLSSSGLKDRIEPSFGSLAFINSLDLSNNSLTGSVPDFFADMSSLRLLNLSGNNLSGVVPYALLEMAENNLLVLSIDGNPDLISHHAAHKNTMKKSQVRVMIGVGATVVFLKLIALIVSIIKRSGYRKDTGLVDPEGNMVRTDLMQFNYKDLKKITGNFETEIGGGGFGKVYLGTAFESKQKVAVKVLSSSSGQGMSQFVAEVKILSKVYHKNLVSLIGYCTDKKHMALVYEYMRGGNLHTNIMLKINLRSANLKTCEMAAGHYFGTAAIGGALILAILVLV